WEDVHVVMDRRLLVGAGSERAWLEQGVLPDPVARHVLHLVVAVQRERQVRAVEPGERVVPRLQHEHVLAGGREDGRYGGAPRPASDDAGIEASQVPVAQNGTLGAIYSGHAVPSAPEKLTMASTTFAPAAPSGCG